MGNNDFSDANGPPAGTAAALTANRAGPAAVCFDAFFATDLLATVFFAAVCHAAFTRLRFDVVAIRSPFYFFAPPVDHATPT